MSHKIAQTSQLWYNFGMSKAHDHHHSDSTLHPIDAFGIKRVSLSSIRIERLENRIHPLVPFPHKHDFYQLILMTAGSGLHHIDFSTYKITKNQLFVMKPAQVHTWHLKGAQGYVVEFNRDSLHGMSTHALDMIKQLDFTPDALTFKTQEFEQLKTVTKLMMEEFMAEKEHLDLALRGYLMAFLIQVLRNSPIGKQAKSIDILDRFRNLVEDNFKHEHRVEFYAKELKLTPKALTMQLSRLMGKAPRQLIQERCLLEAKRYLAYSALPIADIGYELGFEDANYFTRFFRLHEKMTPAKFRKGFYE